MAELRLIYHGKTELRPLLETALNNELKLLEAGINKTKCRLKNFEAKYNMSTDKFISDYFNDEINETIELAEWIGESKMLEKLVDKSTILKSIQFEN